MLKKIIYQPLAFSLKKFTSPTQIFMINSHFCSQRYVYNPFMEHYAETAIRAHRRLHLNQAVLNQSKDVVYATLRNKNQDLISLKQKGKCVGVIDRHSGLQSEEIDVVLDGRKFKSLSKSHKYGVQEVYVRVQGEQYRCVIPRIHIHNDGFIVKVYLRQYVPGKPNKLRVPIELTHITQNPYTRSNGNFTWNKEQVDVICYNEEYPQRFYIDISYVSPERPYRLGDLANTFPPGLLLDQDQDLRTKLCTVIRLSENQKAMQKQMIKQAVEDNKKKKQKPGAGGATGGATGGAAGSAGASGGTQKKK